MTAQRPKTPFSPDREAANCPGWSCKDRRSCLNYRRHAAFPIKGEPAQRWVSWDVERAKIGGDCPAYERIPLRKAA